MITEIIKWKINIGKCTLEQIKMVNFFCEVGLYPFVDIKTALDKWQRQ